MGHFSNRITKLFGINLPIIQAGMVWTSGWRLARAVSNAGASGSGFVLASTHDGGDTWESSVVLPGEDPREGSIYFMDENHGSLLSGGKFFYSEDGGKTWSQRIPTPATWATSKETPTLYHTIDSAGQNKKILIKT